MPRCALPEDIKKKIIAAAAQKLGSAPEHVVMRDDHVYKKGTWFPTKAGEKSATEILEQIDAPRGQRE